MNGPALTTLESHDAFVGRHIGTSPADQAAMLRVLGFASRAALIDALVPAAIRERAPLPLPGPMSEPEALARLAELAARRGETGVMPHTAGFFKSPLAGGTHDFPLQMARLSEYAARARARA